MGEVYVGRYRGSDGQFGPMVAVKRLLPHLVRDSAIVQMFLNEAKITAQINHPNVVRILDLGHENGEPYIAMELLEGHSFAELRSRAAQLVQRVPLGITLKILADACRGLDAAHRAVDDQGRLLCIVHRDFTPDNIHVGVSGDIKVIDFGIAKADNVGSSSQPGILKGKYFYMSPEMITGRPVDHRADIFAAGVMLYEQLCARRPFTGSGPDEVLARIAEGQPRRPVELDPSVPPVLESICLMALSREPEKRFANLGEFIHAIESVGGAAHVATREEVGGYVSRMFTADEDPKRQALLRARAADPSLPIAQFGIRPGTPQPAPLGWASGATDSTPTPLAAPGSASVAPDSTPTPSAPPGSASVAGDSTPTPSAPPGSAGVAPDSAPTPLAGTPQLRASHRRWPWVAGAGLFLCAAAGGVAYWKLHPGHTPARRLTDAQATADPLLRAQLLEPLGEDARTTAHQFKKAGNLLLTSGLSEAALKIAERFAARFPLEEAAPLIEARASIKLRLGKRAQAAIEKAAVLSPMDTEPDFLLGELREAQGDLGAALEAVNRAVRKRPNSPILVARQGYLLSQTGRLGEAAEALAAVLQKRFDADSAAELGYVRLRQKETSEAVGLLRRAVRKDPRLAKGHYYLGAALAAQGDLKGAEREYREADGIAPEDPRPLSALCEMHARRGNAAGVKDVKRLLATRFPREALALQARCAP